MRWPLRRERADERRVSLPTPTDLNAWKVARVSFEAASEAEGADRRLKLWFGMVYLGKSLGLDLRRDFDWK